MELDDNDGIFDPEQTRDRAEPAILVGCIARPPGVAYRRQAVQSRGVHRVKHQLGRGLLGACPPADVNGYHRVPPILWGSKTGRSELTCGFACGGGCAAGSIASL